VFTLHGKNYYVAVCYDSFGIRKGAIAPRNIDAIVDLVHGFHPKGIGDSGDVYFAKHGFAGASKQWGCPVFGAAVFFRRDNTDNWPSAVYWDQAEKSTQRWRYTDNPLSPRIVRQLAAKEGVATVRVYDLEREAMGIEPVKSQVKEKELEEKDGAQESRGSVSCDDRCKEIFRMCQEHHLPLPVTGYELMDTAGGVCAEAELAWPEKKIAVLLPEQAQYEARFSEQGWTMFSTATFAGDTTVLQATLTGSQQPWGLWKILESLSQVFPFSLIQGKGA
jgi:hypothetical protein